MTRPHHPAPPEPFQRIPTQFQAGSHTLTLALAEDWRWSVQVDGTPLPGTFETRVEAWEAGVREAARLG